MASRLLVILALVFQPMTLWLSSARAATLRECGPISCCEVVVPVSCCGEPMAERQADHRDECRCGMSSDDAPERAPIAPSPRTETGVGLALVEMTGDTVNDDGARVARRTPRPVVLTALRTHNETRAILSVWRT
jgi:hypothetical protein